MSCRSARPKKSDEVEDTASEAVTYLLVVKNESGFLKFISKKLRKSRHQKDVVSAAIVRRWQMLKLGMRSLREEEGMHFARGHFISIRTSIATSEFGSLLLTSETSSSSQDGCTHSHTDEHFSRSSPTKTACRSSSRQYRRPSFSEFHRLL